MDTPNLSSVPPPPPPAPTQPGKSHKLLITIVALVLAVLLMKSMFRVPTGARAQDSSASASASTSTVPSTPDANQDSTPAASEAVSVSEPASEKPDAANPVIGMWLLASAQPDHERGQYGLCSIWIRFGRTTFSRSYDGQVAQGSITYYPSPTKVWVMMQGLQATSYGVNPDGTIVAQDYPPCTCRRQ